MINPPILHAIHTACGIETSKVDPFNDFVCIACNPYRLRYFFIFRYFFSNDGFFLWHNEAITKMFCWEG